MIKTKYITFNVNGMRDGHKRLAILSFLKSLQADFILLQETHADTASEWGGEWEGVSRWAPGTCYSRGCALLCGPGSRILKSVTDPDGRYILAKVKTNAEGVLNLVCVYAPDKPGERVVFLDSLIQPLATFCGNDPVIMAGDFNFVENANRDRIGSDPTLSQFTRGSVEFDQIARLFDLADTFVTVGVEEGGYTWSNKSESVQSRLDRFYCSTTDSLSPVSLSTLRVTFSDHKIVQLVTQSKPTIQRGEGYWKLNTALLKDRSYRVAIQAALDTELDYKGENLSAWWDRLKTIFRSESKREAKRRAFRLRQREDSLQKQVNTLAQAVTVDVQSLTDAVDDLRTLRLEKARGAQARSGQQLAETFETPNSYFYAVEKARAAGKNMERLDVDGVIETDQETIRSAVHSFYANLYTPDTPISQIDRNFFLNHISNKFPKGKENDLTEEITANEVKQVINKMANGKAPGIDGIPYEFYKEFQEELSGLLAEVFSHTLKQGKLTNSQRHAVISLLPKKGDLTKLTNWRPVSLQCCDAKILSKVLANRLKLAMPDLVSASQVCSVPGRQIQDHLLLIREAISMAKHKKRPMYVISLDQEKAFDRVDWDFMFQVLLKFGIPEGFVEYVRMLYNDPISVACVNGNFTAPIEIKRGVRQGCPLSMLLYALVAESVGNAMDADDQICGVLTPSGKREGKKIQFADDTNAILRDTGSIYALFDLFKRYESGTGARICPHKTRGIAVNHRGNFPCDDIPIQWNKPDTKILGVFFTGDLGQSAKLNWERVIGAVEKRTTGLALRSLSLRAKAMLVNTLVLSKAWHVGRVFLPSESTVRRLDALVFPYVWHPSKELISRINMKLPFEKGGVNLLPVRTQCVALQLQDLCKMGDDEGPLWVHFARYWLGDRVSGFLKEWKKLRSNSLPKHVIGQKPNHHREILPYAKDVIPGLGPNSRSAQSIRRALRKGDTLTEAAVKARRHIKDLASIEICWKTVSKCTYGLAVPAKHCDIRLRLSHNAIPTNANMARWQHTGRTINPKCSKCEQAEDALHVFLCESFLDLRRDVLNALSPILEPGLNFVDLIFCKTKHPLVQSFVAETMHQMWSSRCKSQHEQKPPDCKVLYSLVVRKVKLGLAIVPSAAAYNCKIFDAISRLATF